MGERRLGEEPPAAQGAAVEPGHLGAGAGLIDEDELVGIDKGPCRLPDAAARHPGDLARSRGVSFVGWPAPLPVSVRLGGKRTEGERTDADCSVRDRPGQKQLQRRGIGCDRADRPAPADEPR
jgi:hypothetical protein